jgi:hypothetical protein
LSHPAVEIGVPGRSLKLIEVVTAYQECLGGYLLPGNGFLKWGVCDVEVVAGRREDGFGSSFMYNRLHHTNPRSDLGDIQRSTLNYVEVNPSF